MTWRQSSRTVRDYCDRMELGSATTPAGRKVGIDGYIELGKEFDKYGGGFQDSQAFGGEMY